MVTLTPQTLAVLADEDGVAVAYLAVAEPDDERVVAGTVNELVRRAEEDGLDYSRVQLWHRNRPGCVGC